MKAVHLLLLRRIQTNQTPAARKVLHTQNYKRSPLHNPGRRYRQKVDRRSFRRRTRRPNHHLDQNPGQTKAGKLLHDGAAFAYSQPSRIASV